MNEFFDAHIRGEINPNEAVAELPKRNEHEYNKQLFAELRHKLPIVKSKSFIQFTKHRKTGKDFHHLLGSSHGIKLTDLLGVCVDHKEHLTKIENDKANACRKYLAEAISNLFHYIIFLENCLDIDTKPHKKKKKKKKL
jgi:hypothetical protein